MGLEFEDEIISHIAISKDEKFVDTHDVPPSAPIACVTSSDVCMYASTSKLEARREVGHQEQLLVCLWQHVMSSSKLYHYN